MTAPRLGRHAAPAILKVLIPFIVVFLCSCEVETSRQPASLIPVWTVDSLREFRGESTDGSALMQVQDTMRIMRQFGDTMTFANPSSVRIVGDFVLVTDRLTDPHIIILDRRTSSVMRHFGRHGQGPGEFRDPDWPFVVADFPPLIWLYDFQNRRFSLLRLDAPDDSMVLEEFSLNPSASIERPVWSAGRIVTNGLFPDYTLLVLDRLGSPVSQIGANPPFSDREMPLPVGRRLMNRNFLASDPSARRIALAYQFRNQIDFFTVAGGYYGTAHGPRETTPRYAVRDGRFQWEDGNEMAYQELAATDNFVYALFCGCRLGTDDAARLLHIFRWNGEFVGEIAFDKAIGTFTVSKDDEFVYASIEEPYPMIGEWKLPGWLRSTSSASAP